MNNIKYATIIPLIGGFPLGAEKELGKPPEYVISFPPFAANDSHYIDYLEKKHGFSRDKYVVLDNCNENKIVSGDIKSLYTEIDIVTSTPPCAGLSMLNAVAESKSDCGRGVCAVQNEWMKIVSEFTLSKIQPKVLIFENAPGLYTSKAGLEFVALLNSIARKYNYTTSAMMTSTNMHGIPQKRKRTFFYFWKSELSPIMEFSDPEKAANSIGDFFNVKVPYMHDDVFMRSDLEDDPYYNFMKETYPDFREAMTESGKKTMIQHIRYDNRFDELYDYITKNYSDNKAMKFMNHAMKKIGMGLNFFDPSPNYFGKTCFNAIVAKSLTHTIHPIEDRFLSVGELLYLMGHPSDFEVTNPKKNYNHIAQNVPVVAGAYAVSQAVKFINSELEPSDGIFIKQNNIKGRRDEV